MSKPDKSIDPLIINSAKKEFLEKGFEGASLKQICANAKVTTGALYKRYSGKEDLFSAVVADVVNDMNEAVEQKRALDVKKLSDKELIESWEMDKDYMMWWYKFLYERYDGFVLLLCHSQGTKYADFEREWVDKMTTITYGYYREAYERKITDTDLSKKEVHILLTAFWATIYEPFIQGYSLDEIDKHCDLICRLFNWKKTLGFRQ